MTTPALLKKGDRVAVIAPGGKVSMQDISAGVEVLQSWGLKVIMSENLLGAFHSFSGTDKERADDLQRAINDDGIRAVFCARGGYGTVRIVDNLDFSPLLKNPKWFIGFSDITVLHSIMSNLNIESVHAPVLTTFMNPDDANMICLHAILFGEELPVMPQTKPPQPVSNIPGCAQGEIVGGNLSILHNLSGTNDDIDTNGKILFLEDVNEYQYNIDRMMVGLKKSGKLASLKGLIIGDMSTRENTEPFGKTAEEIIYEHVKDYHYPVLFGFPAGHIKNNYPLVFGRRIDLTIADDSGTITYCPNANKEKNSAVKRMLKSGLYILVFFILIWLLYFVISQHVTM